MATKSVISKIALLAAISLLALVAAVACAEEAAEPAAPLAAQAAAEPAAPQAPTGQAPGAPRAAAAPAQPKAAQAAAEPEAPKAAAAGPAMAKKKIETRTGPATVFNVHDTQVLNLPGRMRSNMSPWRDGGGNRDFSLAVFGTLFHFSANNEVVPWIATSWEVNDGLDVYIVKLRDDAVFQDGTPVTAADFKAYWEHGAKPENIVAWGGASLTIGEILGWDELKAGDVTEAVGLNALDDQTLEITLSLPFPTWPFALASWHTGISKLSQVLADDDWGNAPIGAGPYGLTYDPNTGLTVATKVSLTGGQWWGGDSIIDKMVFEAIPDPQVQLIMFENAELDIMGASNTIYEAALDPSHPFNSMLVSTNAGGLGGYFIAHILRAPLEDLFVRKSLAQAVDMETVLHAIRGPSTVLATGLIPPSINCHNPDATGHIYDPELARQFLSESTYSSAANLPVLQLDLAKDPYLNIGVAMKEYWKDNLNVELDILKRERGIGRRPNSQWGRHSAGAWLPDPVQIVSTMTVKDIGELDDVPGAYDVMDALEAYARGLPLDHPDRCAAFQAVEQEYMDQVYMIPLWFSVSRDWLVQPWVKGFTSGFNLHVPVWDIFIEKH